MENPRLAMRNHHRTVPLHVVLCVCVLCLTDPSYVVLGFNGCSFTSTDILPRLTCFPHLNHSPSHPPPSSQQQPSLIFTWALPYHSNHRHKSLKLHLSRAHESLSSVPPTYRSNATFVMLCRNKELKGVLWSVRQIQDRFNGEAGYPWTFLNDEPFSDEFKECV